MALVLAAACGGSAAADTVRGIRVLADRPIAPRGGVMLVPLGARRPGTSWPRSLGLTMSDGTRLHGQVIWFAPSRPRPVTRRRWTEEPPRPVVRAVAPTDDSSVPAAGAPYLVVRLPEHGAGPIRLSSQTIHPRWRDPSRAYTFDPLPGDDRPKLEVTASPDRPDPDSPFAYWRWVLLADRLDHRPPAPDRYGEIGGLVAEHFAALWRIALGRLAEHSIPTAAACLDQLTRICTDRPHRFAGWVVGADELDELLSGLLDFRRDGDRLVADARGWLRIRPPLAAWSERDHGDRVTLALVNRSLQPLVARVQWEGRSEPPMTVELRPGALTLVDIERPAAAAAAGAPATIPDDPMVRLLSVTASGEMQMLPIGRPVTTVRPPGFVLPPPRPPLTLAAIETGRGARVPPEQATLVQVRRLRGRWEVFVECARPASARPFAQPNGPDEDESMRGVEAITLLLGPEAGPAVVLAVPESGPRRMLEGIDDGTLEIHRRSYEDRWYCRIVLPTAWLPDPTAVLIGLRRSHGDGDAIETTPKTGPPWRQTASRAMIDLTGWDD